MMTQVSVCVHAHEHSRYYYPGERFQSKDQGRMGGCQKPQVTAILRVIDKKYLSSVAV